MTEMISAVMARMQGTSQYSFIVESARNPANAFICGESNLREKFENSAASVDAESLTSTSNHGQATP
jgi:hypothetical protein